MPVDLMAAALAPQGPINPYSEEASKFARQSAMAQALMKQSMTPLDGRKVGNVYVAPHPLEALVKALGMYKSEKMLDEAGAGQAALQQRIQGERGAKLAEALGAGSAPAAPMPDADLGGGPARAAIPADPLKGLQMLAASQDPTLIQMGAPVLQAQQKAAEADEQRTFKAKESALTRAEAVRKQESDQLFRDWLVTNKAENDRPFYQPVQTAQGIMAFNARTGKLEPISAAGKPVVGAANDPTLQRELAGAKAGGKEQGEAQAGAAIALPQTVAKADQSIALIDKMIGSEDGTTKAHPGFTTSVGMGLGSMTKHVPGTAAANFHAILDQVKGQAFLQGFESLKGSGAITEVEGKKATEAITRMRTSQSESAFTEAAREFQGIIRQGVERAKQRAGGPAAPYSGPERRVPAGVDAKLWAVMTPEEQALFK